MQTIEIDEFILGIIVGFLTKLNELGCDDNTDPRIWFSTLPDEQARQLGKKLSDIMLEELEEQKVNE